MMKNVKLLLVVVFVFLFVAASVIVQRTAEGQTKATGAELCKDCHEAQYNSYLKSKHSKKGFAGGPANKEACNACHLQGAAHLAAGGGAGAGGMVSLGSKKMSVETKNAACLSCHASSKNLTFWDMGAHKKNDVACISCHNVHGKKIKQVETCTGCHKDIKRDINRASHHPIVEGKVKCSDCHNPHGTLSHGMIKAENTNQLCYTCHADKRGPYVWEHPPVEEDCLICHGIHGTRSAKLMKEKTPNVCQDCHDWQRHPGTIYDAKAGFTGSSPSNRFYGRNCLNCHSTIHGGNAPVNPANGYNSGKAFVR